MPSPLPTGRTSSPPPDAAGEPTLGQALDASRRRIARFDPEDAGLQARLLAGHVLGLTTAQVEARRNDSLAPGDAGRLNALVDRLEAGEPLPYLLGEREFHGRSFLVDQRVLIPRPETEHLLEHAVAACEARAGSGLLSVADIGTGSGILAISLALALPRATIFALDVSRDALEVALRNAQRYRVHARITWCLGDFADSLPGPVDVLVANLPYVPTANAAAMTQGRLAPEPLVALDGQGDGTGLNRRLLETLPRLVRPGGVALMEFGAGQVPLLEASFPPGWPVVVHRDLGGHDRVLVLSHPGT